jgi:hypothetical protein
LYASAEKMSLILGLKITLVPTLIAAITLAGRRWGPGVAGWLSAFPVVSAPILFFIALEQGAEFAADAAAATLSAVLAILVFGVAYARSALRFAWPVSAMIGFLCYFAAVVLINAWAPSLIVSALAVGIALIVAPRVYPHPPVTVENASRPVSLSVDIGLRMIAGAALVLLVTYFSSTLGPRLSGMFAMFPVIASVLAIFSHRSSGANFAVNLLRGMVLGYYSFVSFCLALALTLPTMSIGVAFTISLAVALLVQATSKALRRLG